MRVPNASPCGLLSNFETRCSDYFHPNVLAYVLRNRAAQLARHMCGGDTLNSHVLSEVWQIEAAVVSTSCHLEPQTAATLLLSFSKLKLTLPNAIREITRGFKFDSARPKAIALTLNAFSRQPSSLEHVTSNFWSRMEATVENTVQQFLPQDVATCALSTTGILSSYRNNRYNYTVDRSSIQSLKATYKQIMMQAERMLTENGVHNFNTRDLSCVLLSMYSSKTLAPKPIVPALEKLKELIPSSLNGIEDTIGLLDMIPPPSFAGTTVEERRTNRAVARAEKAFVEWCFDYLKDHLDCLKERELARVAAACNRLRSWSRDDFAIKFADAWSSLLRTSEKLPPKTLNHGLCYFMRRYEASVSRELSAGNPVEQQTIAQVSDVCARVGELLYEHAKLHYNAEELRKVEEILHIAEQCRAKRTYKHALRQV